MLLDVKTNALDDGPGIRSVVFFKGCPLSCVWCHNPESRMATPELSFDATVCIAGSGCSRCIPACPQRALNRRNPGLVDRAACDLCFACVDACPPGALARVGRPALAGDIMATLLRDKPFYEASGGGVTFSGGEPTLHMRFLGELAGECKAEGIHTLAETAGEFAWERFERYVLPHVDTVYYDIKLLDPVVHRKYCGVANDRILGNFARLAALAAAGDVELLARVPLVPGITDTEDNVLAIGGFLLAHEVRRVRLLDYNPTWVDKITKIGAVNEFAAQPAMRAWLPHDAVSDLRARLAEYGIEAA